MIEPQIIEHDDVFVVRDDLFPGGSKARFIPSLFDNVSEVVYVSPAEGGARCRKAWRAQAGFGRYSPSTSVSLASKPLILLG